MLHNAYLIGLGPAEIIVILVVAFVLLVILGPKNLPKLGNSIGKGIKGLRKGLSNDDDDDKDKKDQEKDEDEIVVETEEVDDKNKKTDTDKTSESKEKKPATKKKVVRKKSE